MLSKVRLGLTIFFATLTTTTAAQAQITPDGSLPTNVEKLQEIMRINGGERQGDNLFHSFEEFNIRVGDEAIFENAVDIQNIFTRITGGEASTLDGLLQTQGGANLFFINPAGVIFGENAQLDVGGSFIATTADSVQFEDGTSFVANGGNSNVSLTISLPVGLGFSGDNGSITVDDTGNLIQSDTRFSPIDIGDSETGLSVEPGKTLAFIGNEVNFNGGIVTAEGGQIEIASLNSGKADIQQSGDKLTFSFDNAQGFQDINLNQQSLVNVTGEGQSEISLTGENISLSDGSFVLSQNTGNVDSGTIDIDAVESLSLSGKSPNGEVSSSIRSESVNAGRGSQIDIDTQNLSVLDEAQIRTGAYGTGDGKDLTINAPDSVTIIDSSISASTFAEGNAGNIGLTTNQLQIKDSGGITSSTIGTGNGGEVTVKADLIEVSGGTPTARSNISASSFSEGNASSLTIDTDQLKVQDGGSVSSSAFAGGNAGSLTINASESVEVTGKNPDFISSTPESTIRSSVQAATPAGQRALGLPATPAGNARDVTITTPQLNITNEGQVSVENQGTGQGGQVTINADDLNLEDGGSITAETASGNGGNVTINTSNLTSKKNSEITTEAQGEGSGGNVTIKGDRLRFFDSNVTASAGDEGNGGNLTIDTGTILGVDSDFTATAVFGNGGNINITADGLLGFSEGNAIAGDGRSSLDVSSEFGLDGTITIDSPDTSNKDPIIAIASSSFKPIEQKLATKCERGKDGKLLDRRGATTMPESPDDFLDVPIENELRGDWDESVIHSDYKELKRSFCNSLRTEFLKDDPIKIPSTIKISGNSAIEDSELKELIKNKLKGKRETSMEELETIRQDLDQYYLAQGYLITGSLVRHEEDGSVEFLIVEGVLDDVLIQGIEGLKSEYLKANLPSEGKPVNYKEILSAFNKLEDLPSIKSIKGKIVDIYEDKNALLIDIEENNPIKTNLSFNNYFSPSIGSLGGYFQFEHNNLLGFQDRFNLDRSQTEGLKSTSLSYSFLVDKTESRINLNYANASSEVIEEEIEDFDIRGDYESFLVDFQQPIFNRNNEELNMGLSFKHVNSETFILNDFSFAFAEGLNDGESKISALQFSQNYNRKREKNSFGLNSRFNVGLDIFDATRTDLGIDGLFWSWQGSARYIRALNWRNDLLFSTRISTQLTPDKLLPAEQLTMGGINTVRGYTRNLAVADNGVIGTVELITPLFREDWGKVSLSPFLDAGTLWNNDRDTRGDSTFFSAGLGLGYQWRGIEVRADFALPLVDVGGFGSTDTTDNFGFSVLVKP